MQRTNQGGSVLGFVIIGLVLTLLFVGGIYFVRQQQADAPQPATTQPSPQQPAPETPSVQASNPAPTPQQPPQQAAPTDSAPASRQLPQTGSSQLLPSVLALGLLIGFGMSYARSRRPGLAFDL